MHNAAARQLHYAKSKLLSLLYGCKKCLQSSSSTHNVSTQDSLLSTTLKSGGRQLQNSRYFCYSWEFKPRASRPASIFTGSPKELPAPRYLLPHT